MTPGWLGGCSGSDGDPASPQSWGWFEGRVPAVRGTPCAPRVLAARGTLCSLWAGCVSGDASALRGILQPPGAGCGRILQRGGERGAHIPAGSSARAGAQQKAVPGLCSQLSRIHGAHIHFSHPEVLREPLQARSPVGPSSRGWEQCGSEWRLCGSRGAGAVLWL